MKKIFSIMIVLGLTACGASDEDNSLKLPVYTAPNDPVCDDQTADVQWQKLLQADAEKLSEYKLFASQCNPTANANGRGLPYNLTTPLFSDYTSKYRFVFVPEDKKASYNQSEVFEFPVGTVLTKTFSMPAETDSRGYSQENILETRLLIKQTEGWIARVYVWDEDKLDASRVISGASIKTVMQHEDSILQFDYKVPNQNSCTDCHQFKQNGDSEFVPIGPKARYLNAQFAYENGTENQIEKWISHGILDINSVPEASAREKTPIFNDDTDIDAIAPSEVENYAKAWLDINCAHCHRDEGAADNTAFKTVYGKSWTGNETYHGACKEPVSGAGTGALVINPGSSSSSLVYQRIHTTDPGLTMPPIGREVIHQESSALIKRWLESLTSPSCN